VTNITISVEGLSPELLDAYSVSGMERGKAGTRAINWAFGGNETAFSVARSGDKVVGISSYIKSNMQFGIDRGTGFQAVDSFVAPEMRGKGLFTSLAKAYADHAQDRGSDLVWGFPNDNAAPAWFGKLGWANHGQVPFLVKPLRAGYFLRKLRLGGDFPLSSGRDQNLEPINEVGNWADELWETFSTGVGCATTRDSTFLNHRLFGAPHAQQYRVVGETTANGGALVATREAEKHGGRIAYVMEALGTSALRGVLESELSRLRDRGVELALAWAYPWSPNYSAFRRSGFLPLPERIRPIRIWFGGRAMSQKSAKALDLENWYMSYLDSDTV
jgi:GNAT superfamily N-acetyltransferase